MNYKETSASDALNTGEYINKLYDRRQNSQQGLIDQNQKDSNAFLNDQSQAVQNQTNDYVNRTNVEAQKAAQQPTTNNRNLSYGATVQQGLTRQNQQQKDVSALNARQAQAEAEVERQRQQLSQYYQTEIQRATAENDLQRAQQLYNAAKSEDQRLQLSVRKPPSMQSPTAITAFWTTWQPATPGRPPLPAPPVLMSSNMRMISIRFTTPIIRPSS